MKLFFHHIGQNQGTPHLSLTVYQDIPIAVVEGAIPVEDSCREEILTDLRTRFPEGLFNAWGVPEGGATVVKRLEPGDAVLLVQSVSEFGEVPVLCLVEVYHHQQLPFLSEALWGSAHFPYIFFFRTRRISLGWREMLSHLGYGDRFNPRGTFGSVLSDRLQRFGGVESYVHGLISESVHSSTYFRPVADPDLAILNAEGEVATVEVNAELIGLQERLIGDPELTERLLPTLAEVKVRPRSTAFRVAVQRLYDYRCAICGSGLRGPNGEPEVEAAHIYPKRLNGSDDVRNGVTLCRRHHWAFDIGWIAIADDLTILVKDTLPDNDDYDSLRQYSGKKLRLPDVQKCRPNPLFLHEHRLIHSFL